MQGNACSMHSSLDSYGLGFASIQHRETARSRPGTERVASLCLLLGLGLLAGLALRDLGGHFPIIFPRGAAP